MIAMIATRSQAPAFAVLATLLVGAGGCYQSYVEQDDVEVDDVGVGDDSATDTGDVSEAGASVCVGGWYDPSSRLCWQNPPDETLRSWDEAVAYCDGLTVGGYNNWHLPTINELRSLIRGCPSTVLGGACRVNDSCVDWSSCRNTACDGCSMGGGPGVWDRYWPPALGETAEWSWSSSSSYFEGLTIAWYVYFDTGWVNATDEWTAYYARCVRPGP
jgi:hypothetical protein